VWTCPHGAFTSEPFFYKTLFHELIHATGHTNRLARKTLLENKSRRAYSEEELVAEMGAAFLAAHAEILEPDQMEESAAYLQGWLSVLRTKENRKWLVLAASQAQKAADYILGE
jgi:antirestriction protein ArdC